MISQNWIVEQCQNNVAQWDNILSDRSSGVENWNTNSNIYFQQVCQKCNYLEAVKEIKWSEYINKKDSVVLDLGCGGGWLSAYLSKFKNVKTILALDSSKNYLFNILPGVVSILKGQQNKIIPIEAMFSPLLLEDDSLDIIVASAAVHHAENLESLLVELNTKLKKGGTLILLNETPEKYFRYIARLKLSFIKTILKVALRLYEKNSPKISASGFEYDPYLGDRAYPLWYWKKALHNSGFELVEYIDTNMPTLKDKKGVSLKHMICKKILRD
ncbi:hypothetical protein fh0823_15470 [Francisella halioticida]|uniref:Methyltransferase type 11 domain-containing protein n=1 Tax=Francisella halioticida TaxID=549298 RepID=A0ABN5B374_9GAMM|nr:class I SAM-dependent methyltransferase [Francisella halioticida]ASG68515.1 hypothetical protein CDV26_09040 [Francisella halioticida]BCD91408.1 hypothetical protein fh0823_15470 [Francisella halioticida]